MSINETIVKGGIHRSLIDKENFRNCKPTNPALIADKYRLNAMRKFGQ